MKLTSQPIALAGSVLLAGILVSAARAQCELSANVGSNAVPEDRFGFSVDLSGDRFAVGTNTDRSYVFLRTGLTFAEEAELVPGGDAVAISGDRVVVAGVNGTHVFRGQAGTWTHEQDLGVTDPMSLSVDIEGDTIVVGTPLAAAVHVFVRNGTTWTLQETLTSTHSATGLFGFAVSLDNDALLVGAPEEDNLPQPNGAAFLFSRAGGVWTELQRITLPGTGMILDDFGTNVSLSGEVAVIARNNPGRTYLYMRVGNTLVHEITFTVPAGNAISISGDRVAIGFNGDDTMGFNTGSARVYVRSGGTWIERLRVFASDPVANDRFGTRVQLTGTAMIVSAPFRDDGGSNTGAVYVFSVLPFPDSDCNGNGIPDACDILTGSSQDANGNGQPDECEIGTNYCSATVNSSGFPADIAALGSEVLSDNDVTFVTRHVPREQFGVFLASQSRDFVPMHAGGQGNLCLGLPLVRLSGPLTSGTNGQIIFSPDLLNPPPGTVFQSGDNWNFQAWFRDFNPRETSNLTNATSITFL